MRDSKQIEIGEYMQIEYGICPFIFLLILFGVSLRGMYLITEKFTLKLEKQEWGKIILGTCICVAVPLTMDSVVDISSKVIILNCYAWFFYFILSIITVLCSGALVSLYKTK